MNVVVSVPGKIHLMGEHAVVYGKPALLTAVNRRMTVTVSPSDVSGKTEVLGNTLEIISTEPDTYVRQIVAVVQKELNMPSLPPLRITITSGVTPGYHLGSSAATAVGVTAALVYFLKQLWNPIRINEIAYEAEKLQHGTPSGGDNTAVCFGGLVWYRKELEFLKSMWQLPVRIDASLQKFFLLDTGRPKESTAQMITIVKENKIRYQQKMHKAFEQNETQTKRLTQAIKETNETELVEAIRLGERSLEVMGVVSPLAKTLIRGVEKSGGAAKILGGGGKARSVGYILCYHPQPEKLKSFAHTQKYALVPIQLGEEGVRLEQKP